MNTSITDKLPIETIGESVIDSVHRVGDMLPDRVPAAVHGAVVDGVDQGRRIGRHVLDHLPTHHEPDRSKRWIALWGVLTFVGVAVVVWRVRSRRAASLGTARDDWSLHEAKASNRDVA